MQLSLSCGLELWVEVRAPGGYSPVPSPGTSLGHRRARAAGERRASLPFTLLVPRKLWLTLNVQIHSYIPRKVAVYGGAPNSLQHLRTVLINE